MCRFARLDPGALLALPPDLDHFLTLRIGLKFIPLVKIMATEDVAAWISGFSMLIAFVSAIVARDARVAASRSADSAERANDINLHQSKLDIFKGFQAFHGALVQRGTTLHETDVWPFFSKANLAEFYFDEGIHKRLIALANDALAAISKAEELEFANQTPGFDRPTKTNMRAEVSAKFKSLRDECSDMDVMLRDELRLHRPKPQASGPATS